jgi:transposase
MHAAEVESLRLLIARLQRLQFGRKSEKIQKQIEQLELQPASRPLPDHLPREIQRHEPAHDGCPACGAALSELGEDVSEVLEYVPARFKVIRHVRPKLSCTRCDVIVQAEAASRPIERAWQFQVCWLTFWSPNIVTIFRMYRQAEIYAREGVELKRSTLADWVGATSELVSPLIDALRQYVMGSHKLHADDTPVPVLAPGTGKTKLGRLWTYVRDDRPSGAVAAPTVWFAYSPDAEASIRTGTWQLFKAHYKPMVTLASTGSTSGRIQGAACWAHVRPSSLTCIKRTLRRLPPNLLSASVIYMRSRARSVAVRQTNAKGCALHPGHPGIAAGLAQKQHPPSSLASPKRRRRLAMPWDVGLRSCVIVTPAFEIDNNSAERALRAVALGRKNYLFADSDTGGKHVAALYSLMGSAKLNDLDSITFTRSQDGPTGCLRPIASYALSKATPSPPRRATFFIPPSRTSRFRPDSLRKRDGVPVIRASGEYDYLNGTEQIFGNAGAANRPPGAVPVEAAFRR